MIPVKTVDSVSEQPAAALLFFEDSDNVFIRELQLARHNHAHIARAQDDEPAADVIPAQIDHLLRRAGGENTGGARPGKGQHSHRPLPAAGGENDRFRLYPPQSAFCSAQLDDAVRRKSGDGCTRQYVNT